MKTPEPKVKSITEAFSQQPAYFSITDKPSSFDPKSSIAEIVLENHTIGTNCGDPVEQLYYVGKNFDGEMIFRYVANSVNVHYVTEKTESDLPI